MSADEVTQNRQDELTGSVIKFEATPRECRRPACPACGGTLIEVRQKLQCGCCHTIVETCCEGGRG